MKNIINNEFNRRKLKDGLANGATFVSSFFSFVILLSIILFVFIKGGPNFDFRMITSNYYETPYFALIERNDEYSFEKENTSDTYYSKQYGVGLKDSRDLEGNKCVLITYIDKNSPFNIAKDTTNNEHINVITGQIIKRIQIYDGITYKTLTPKVGAQAIVEEMDHSISITELYYSTIGGGIRGSLITTFILIVITLIIAIPIGVIAAIYLSIYAKKNKLTTVLRSLIDMIAGVPSIIFGLIAMIIFIPFVSKITSHSGGSILSGALTMSIMLLPTIIKTTEESINQIPNGYKLSSLALGASETQTTFKVILPNAIPGILTSIILSIGRIIGESAALIFAIGTSIQDKVSLFDGSTTLAVHIWSIMAGQNPNYAMACSISLIILALVLTLNILVKVVCKKLNRFEVK